MSRIIVRTVVLAAATTALGLGAATGSATDAAELCQGRAATIVGSPGAEVTGTDGADVVVSNGATEVVTGAGDDLVCVTAGSRKDDVDVLVGDGDDVVDASSSTSGTTRAELGDGDDSYVGGPGPDLVGASDYWQTPPDQGADTVSTGPGDDTVVTGGTPKNLDHDAVDLGEGDDDAWLTGPVDPARPILGGAGRDRLELDRVSMVPALVLDNAAGQATDSGVPVMTWSGMEDFRLTPFSRWQPPSFIGGDGAERVWTSVPLAEARLGGGDDRLNLDLDEGPLLADSCFEGGRGQDTFIIYAGAGDQAERVSYDRRHGSMLFQRDRQVAADLQVDGFDRFRMSARHLELRGTARPDHFAWSGCHGVVDGRGGDDVLRIVHVPDAECGNGGEHADLVARGGAGDDRMIGNDMPDVLIGGPGDDFADGDGNVDRCVAETRRRCEHR